jgi:hypothetical protein
MSAYNKTLALSPGVAGSGTTAAPCFSAAAARQDFQEKWKGLWTSRVGPFVEKTVKNRKNSRGNGSFTMSWGDFGHKACGINHGDMASGSYDDFKSYVVKMLQGLGFQAESRAEKVQKRERRREGLHKKIVTVEELQPNKILYVSWGPGF